MLGQEQKIEWIKSEDDQDGSDADGVERIVRWGCLHKPDRRGGDKEAEGEGNPEQSFFHIDYTLCHVTASVFFCEAVSRTDLGIASAVKLPRNDIIV